MRRTSSLVGWIGFGLPLLAYPLLCVSTATAAAATAAEEKLVAPVYPGSVRLTPPRAKGREMIVFTSQDPPEKVRAFYEPKYARLPANPRDRNDTSIGVALVVHTYEQALAIITKSKGDFIWASPSLVVLEWLSSKAPQKTVPFFRELERQAKKFPGHDAELAELENRYAWLARASYTDNMGDKIDRRCSNEASGMDPALADPAAAKAFQEKLRQLAAEGRQDEVTALAKQFDKKAKAGRNADHFALWKGCLEEAAGFAYRTRIKIHQDPTLWTY